MNDTIITPDVRVGTREGRKPWRRPTLQRMNLYAAEDGAPGGSSDACFPMGDMRSGCS